MSDQWHVHDLGPDVDALISAETGEFAKVIVPPGADPSVIAQIKTRHWWRREPKNK
ncbi:hypothetical protein GT755_12170 [Herbidospora sp. NEAU-GS84]|uniref:Uncharacterized protein n=1 Tax=Herbidospora solisilvae TaxID=2696284 RepID=A0A7C9NZZ9_9ACTN|nr:hypothetical protein [Herbidospora solisilvae]NAS22437.1 hypothetical protein [Herbidospora solisilvae]